MKFVNVARVVSNHGVRWLTSVQGEMSVDSFPLRLNFTIYMRLKLFHYRDALNLDRTSVARQLLESFGFDGDDSTIFDDSDGCDIFFADVKQLTECILI